MGRLIDLTGKKFGRLTVIERIGKNKFGQATWLCRCKCGNEKEMASNHLRYGKTKSCGCWRRDYAYILIERNSSPLEKRLLKRIDKSSGRWMWIGMISDTTGYGRVYEKGKCCQAHRAVYETFVGEIPEGLCVCHRNDIKLDVTPSNLFIGTNQENTQDKINKGRQAKGESNGQSKLKEKDVLDIRESFKNGERAVCLSKKFNVDKSIIYDIVNRNYWKHI